LGRVAHLHIEVAAYPEFRPESASAKSDLDHFATKVRAGANSAITQYFFNVDGYCRFVEECEARGLDLPIGPGIMPITNYKQLVRFSDACGAEIPRWISASDWRVTARISARCAPLLSTSPPSCVRSCSTWARPVYTFIH
jgi:5,10-methylenetetrahydrofolate reductase